ncbi:MAG: hypothetical protein V3T05_08440 [Myxococcota bacterium]
MHRLAARASTFSIIVLSGCASAKPSWYPSAPRADRTGAYEWFLIVTGAGVGSDRISACDAADDVARATLTSLLIEHAETQSDVVAAAGGPSRVEAVLRTFAAEATLPAPRTRDQYDDARRKCYVELHWLLPRHLASAVRRVVDRRATEEDVADEMRRALAGQLGDTGDETERQPVSAQRGVTKVMTPEAAIEANYPEWFWRVMTVPDCETHRIAFVGAPSGAEARWLELKKSDTGWLIVDDERINDKGWPTPPAICFCD